MFAFDPPGGMTTANLAHAVEGFVTSVCVGKDSISRLGTLTFDRIMDQARCEAPLHMPSATAVA